MNELQSQLALKDEVIRSLTAELQRYIDKFGYIDSPNSAASLLPQISKHDENAADATVTSNSLVNDVKLLVNDVSDTFEVFNRTKADSRFALPYMVDSPAFRHNLDKIEESCSEFRIFLNNVSAAAKQYLSAGCRFNTLNTSLINEIDHKKHPKVELEDISSNPFEACDTFRDLLVQVGCSSDVLLLNLETILHKPFDEFVEVELREASEKKKEMVRAGEEYECLLNKSLLKNRQGSSLLPVAALTTSPLLDNNVDAELQKAKSRFEMARFDLVQYLNELEAKKVILIYEAFSGAIHAYGSHFSRCSRILTGFLFNSSHVTAKLKYYHERSNTQRKLWIDMRSKLKETSSHDDKVEGAFRNVHSGSGKDREGYLFVRNPMFPGRSWKRIWFEIEGDQLYQVHSKETYRGLVCDLTLCTVRQSATAANLPYCFEILDKSGQNRRVFQAENLDDMNDWIQAIRSISEKQIELQLEQHFAVDIEQLLGEGSNEICADCGKLPAEWVSINWGVLLCIECSGVHRSLGVHVSKVRSLRLDKLDTTIVEIIRYHLGNDRVNSIMESSLPSGWRRPLPDSSRDLKVKWINAKYKFFGFSENLKLPKAELLSTMTSASATGDILALLRCITQGADVNSPELDESPLHIAARNGHLLCCEYLVLNNASLVATNNVGMLPFDAAKAAGFEEVKLFLMQKMTLEQYQH